MITAVAATIDQQFSATSDRTPTSRMHIRHERFTAAGCALCDLRARAKQLTPRRAAKRAGNVLAIQFPPLSAPVVE